MSKYYKLYRLNTDNYDCLVICLSYESIFTYIDVLQKAILESGIKNGTILIDQLLISGNGKNRFLALNFTNGLFDYTTAKNTDADIKYHQITSFELKRDESILENSVLTEKQIAMIKKGCIL